jgi:hypothetical protein
MKASKKVAWAMAHGWRLVPSGPRRWMVKHLGGNYAGPRSTRTPHRLAAFLGSLYHEHVEIYGPEPHGQVHV